jgi:hypothetical protein
VARGGIAIHSACDRASASSIVIDQLVAAIRNASVRRQHADNTPLHMFAKWWSYSGQAPRTRADKITMATPWHSA